MKTDMLLNGKLKINTIDKKHLNGYIYDSLVYRYIRAREAMAQLERERDHSIDSFKQARRDIMRFCQILNEAIGEHD